MRKDEKRALAGVFLIGERYIRIYRKYVNPMIELLEFFVPAGMARLGIARGIAPEEIGADPELAHVNGHGPGE